MFFGKDKNKGKGEGGGYYTDELPLLLSFLFFRKKDEILKELILERVF
jgi:hypothetical protein